MHTPEFLDWHDERTRSHPRNEPFGVAPLAKSLERDIKGYEGELRALIDAGLVNYKQA